MEKTERKEPALPTDRHEPTDPMDRTDPFDPMHKTESCDQSAQREVDSGDATDSCCQILYVQRLGVGDEVRRLVAKAPGDIESVRIGSLRPPAAREFDESASEKSRPAFDLTDQRLTDSAASSGRRDTQRAESADRNPFGKGEPVVVSGDTDNVAPTLGYHYRRAVSCQPLRSRLDVCRARCVAKL